MDVRVLAKLRDRLFYDPHRFVSRSRNVVMGDSLLGRPFRVRFDRERDDVALRIGDRCLLSNTFVFESTEGKVAVGDGVFINSGTMVIARSSVTIGSGVTIAWDCVIYDHDSHSLDYRDRMADQARHLLDFPGGNMVANKDWSTVKTAPIHIRDDAWLGFGVVVLKGVTIGEGAVIGARAVVAKDVPPWTIAVGNPARVVKEIPRELRRS